MTERRTDSEDCDHHDTHHRTTPGTDFELRGTAYRVESTKFYKQDAVRVRAVVDVNGQTMFADIRFAPEPKGFWNSASDDIESAHADPAAEQQRQDEGIAVDQQTVRQLRETAKGLGVELPAKAKRAELVATLKDALAEQQAAA